jgi:hypothetical protein
MPEFPLPPLFAERMHKLDDALTRLEVTHIQHEKEDIAIEIYCLSCRILHSLNFEALEHELRQQFHEQQQKMDPSLGLFESYLIGYFEGFLSIEMEALKELGINDSARSRAADLIKKIRSELDRSNPGQEPEIIINRVIRLREETCMLCRVSKRGDSWIEKIENDPKPQRNWEKAIRIGTSVFGAGIIVGNVAGSVTGFIDPGSAELSCRMGSAMIKPSEQD